MRIDAHQHYWKLDRGEYGWITPELAVLDRDYLPGDLEPQLAQAGIGGTIVVQAAETYSETDYLLSLSERHDSIVGVVGWLDLFDPDHLEHYNRFARHPKFVGFRLMIQELDDASAVLQPAYVEALRRFAELDVPVDLLVQSHQLDSLVKLLELVPGLRGVVDHIAKPRIDQGDMEPWASQMRQIAAHPGICCKLSGMVTEADHQRWQPTDLQPYIRHALELFGEDRVLFGSDWPVCRLAAEYDAVVDALRQGLPGTWSREADAKLFGGNAAVFYRIKV